MEKKRKKASYPFQLGHKPGFFLGWMLYRLFKRVHFDESMVEELKRMHREGTVVYAMKYRGHLDYLLYHYRFRMSRLPFPKISLDLNMCMMLPLSHLFHVVKFYLSHLFEKGRFPSPFKTGFFEQEIRNGTTTLLSLVDPKGFLRHFLHEEKDHLHFLLEIQKTMTRPIFIVPLLVLYKKTPEKDYSSFLDIFFGFKDKAGTVRKIGLFFRHNRRAFVDFGEPVNLKEHLASRPVIRALDEENLKVRQTLIESIDRQKRVILGPIMKSREQIRESVLRDPGIAALLQEMSGGDADKLRQVKKKAGGYFDEIAADYNIAYVDFFQRSLTWLWKKIFEGIDVDTAELNLVRDWARKGTVIYVPSHKSHIDYLVLNYVLFLHQMHVPRIAAGKNLTFWPMGHIFRKSGAFFIRRTFRGAKLYAEIFERYIKALLEEGHPLEFFIEGGRSRSGKLILPKIGFLSILMKAYQDGFCKDLIFVPASISYDRILEESSYLKEFGGGTKERESFKQLVGARHFLKRKYGKIYIRFGHPLSLTEYLDTEVDEGDRTRQLAGHIIRSINRATLVTPFALVATAILARHRRGFHLDEITSTVKQLLEFLEKYDIPTATTLSQPEEAVRDTMALLMKWKVMEFLEDADGVETFYYVEEEKKAELEYYKNNIIHCFISHAFVAVSLLSGREEIKTVKALEEDYGFIKGLLRNEFVHDPNMGDRQEIERAADYFLDAGFMEKAEGEEGYRLTRAGFDDLSLWAALAKTFLESYWIAARAFMQKGSRTLKSGDPRKNMSYLGTRFHKLGLIDHIEAISQLNFRNATRFLEEDILEKKEGGIDEKAAHDRLSRLSQRLHDLSHYGG